MKILLSLILVFGYHNNMVSCIEVFDYISSKVFEYSNKISNVFINVIDKIGSIMPRPEPDKEIRQPTTGRIGIISKAKKAFSDFVAAEAAQSETESPELFRFRSEPTALMSTPQLATLHGKRVESHLVITDDGYHLTLHRIRSPRSIKNRAKNKIRNFTILMHHGLLGSSADWILLGPEKSLPYILSNIGYDVWLTNARGNYYSRGHSTFKIDSVEFWKFSFEQMGTSDLPAVVEYIMKIKKSKEKLNFIGHSMGATAFLVMLSVYPHFNEYFRLGILLAPMAFMTKVQGPLKLSSVVESHQMDWLKMLGDGEFMPNRRIPSWFSHKYCQGPDLYCTNPLLFLSGSLPDENTWDDSLTARVLYHVPAGGSTNTILHYAQMVKTGKFHKFDNVTDEYNLKQVLVPIVLFSSSDDWLATKVDVLRLYFSIDNPVDNYVIHGVKLSHTDFVWHPEADRLVFSKVVESLECEYNPKVMDNEIKYAE